MKRDGHESTKKEAFTLSDYFRALEYRLQEQYNNRFFVLRVKLCEKIIEMRFADKTQRDIVRRFFVGCITVEEDVTADALFYYIYGDSSKYIPNATAPGVYQSHDSTGYLRYVADHSFLGVDRNRKVFFLNYAKNKKIDTALYGHSMVSLLFQWALTEEMLLLHGAAVGIDNKGVLIAEHGGRGKSTLAVSCLLNGMQFVSDDYTLVSMNGEVCAKPLYRTVGLNTDMHDVLKPDMPIVRIDESRKGKLLLDASAYAYCDLLPLKALVCPKITDFEEPEMVPAAKGSAIAKIVHSTMKPMDIYRDVEAVRLMSQRFLTLPAYEFRITNDVKKNMEFLRSYIINNFN